MKTWLTADWHLGEDRFVLMGRPFKTVEEHIDTIRHNFNDVVAPDDEVVVIGDAVYQKAPQFLPEIATFNGKKTLIRGNHDRPFTDVQLSPYFARIIPEGEGIYVGVDDLRCYLTHYPTEGVGDAFNVVGHIHAAWKYQLNMFNVGVDANHFRPIEISQLHFHYDAVCKFYDQDVWVAYNDINAKFRGQRGKANTYFRP